VTLLVGVLCADGVVLGADSGATSGALGQQHVMVPMSKVEVVRDSGLIAVSGPVGLGQRLTGEFERMLKAGLPGLPYKVMTDLRDVFWKQMKPEWEAANVAHGSIGNAAIASVLSTTLLAMNVGGAAHLFCFDQQGAPEEITAKMPVVSAGSGQHNADVFLAFLRGVYWDDGRAPTLDEGVFTALWALEQCIQISPGSLQGPARIFTLVLEAGKPVARQVPEAELQEHRQAIAAAKSLLKQARQETEAPPPPKPE
jgi:20S proteasome alpha/beta subunit